MTALQTLLNTYREHAKTQREKGTYFEKLIQSYFTTEPFYKDQYENVWMYTDWAKEPDAISHGMNPKDTGIDLIAKTCDGEYHAIQCKLYAEDHAIQKSDIDSFFTASGKKIFAHRIIVCSTAVPWSKNAEDALEDQQIPVTVINLHSLEQSQIDWNLYLSKNKVELKPKKELRPHQKTAVNKVLDGLKEAERGKLLMACGTGKTFTSLKIAEQLAGNGGHVLFLVPSLALLSQALTEWTQESSTPLHSYAVCSDSDVGKKVDRDADYVPMLIHELQYPATTDAKSLAREILTRHNGKNMTVVFSTYHSIETISEAQKKHKLGDFDLIICDEAHRTTGATFGDEDESNFVKVHDAKFIRAAKRLYMTATPRIYADSAQAKAENENITLCSMDDENIYGKTLHLISFSEAVRLDLLVDYKVIVLTVSEEHVNRRMQKLLDAGDNNLKVDDAAKIIGCWKALSKQGLLEVDDDPLPMKRAVAYCQVINYKENAKKYKVASKLIAQMFQPVIEEYQKDASEEECAKLHCETQHIDGSMNASEKDVRLSWLKADPDENTCKILSNVRCLSEGVDVPALDAVLFLTPRDSQVDVVQSVGRVMRKSPGKKRGYVILPVVIPSQEEAHEALNKNETYKVVWQVLQALRSHDDRFDAMINKMELDFNKSMLSKMEVVAVTGKIQKKQERKPSNGRGQTNIGTRAKEESGKYKGDDDTQLTFPVEIGEIERAIYAKIVKKCGNRHHWEEWANDIAKIANTHIDRINAILENPSNKKEREAFKAFADELRDDLNDSITDPEVVEMLAQHMITRPVFEALFSGYSFASNNPVSQGMQQMLDLLHEHNIGKEADTLNEFYASVKMRAAGIENAAGKQKIVVELYDKFFRGAFPKMTERLGIVYTPVEVVDFIIHSVDHLLQKEFGETLGSKGVHILDPFTGTGTFITRLLQSGLIKPEELAYKYKNEIHANEIVLLAYYIAAINIEAVYHSLSGKYAPFEGICLTDTFQLYEHDDLISHTFADNSTRRAKQKKLDIRVIIGNPPYSIGQDSQNDNNQNVAYSSLDLRIEETYAAKSNAALSKGLYDSYIRAIRWASDRVGKSGVVGFVTNAGFIEANSADGLRKTLAEEYSSIYVFHLRGNQRTQGETSRKEGGKIFGSGSRAPIAISFFVKNPKSKESGKIYFYDIGDYLSREEKLGKIAVFQSVESIAMQNLWTFITPDVHGDWINQRDDSFGEHIVVGDKKTNQIKVFQNFSLGVATNRDAWCYNSSKTIVSDNMQRMISFYNKEVIRFDKEYGKKDNKEKEQLVNDFVDSDAYKISWTRGLKQNLARGNKYKYESNSLITSIYRPFNRQWMYFNRAFNEMVLQMPRIFPNAEAQNIVICVTGNGAKEFTTLITNTLPDIQMHFNGQCFPLYLYDTEVEDTEEGSLFSAATKKSETGLVRRDAITDEGLAHFKEAYPDEKITKEDLFYYIYGLLHSNDYRERYADNLSKELPRIPRVKKAEDFWTFSKAGRDLAKLHLNYETVKPYPVKMTSAKDKLTNEMYRVEKMRYGKQKINGKTVDDKTILVYNDYITLEQIPLEAYDYVVNGKSALDWIVERQCVKTDKDSGIVNDANDWAIETMNDPKYPLELFMRVITVSLETMKIVNALPKLDI